MFISLTLLGTGSAQAQSLAMQCQSVSQDQVVALFERWNDTLKTGDAKQVAALYATDALLLPTVSKTPRLTFDEKVDYFQHFLKDRPVGSLDTSHVQIDCNSAHHAGLYTFRFAASGKEVKARYSFAYRWDGTQWLITSHHSSLLPAT
ncbi:SgcJ/EcaC family oxidoreductase [Pseudomonas sp. LS1212]|uniref:SgcJ/EcaC family oxidoreductase n=1 Tax=Pseudomonas sp. LS1212 TaxID=2972478 RepID=UPI00215C5752|nr:SgcJ/EcaC family oxidoreductase [Pseudomonas sp. LS1212]UVJ45844.1 SgcJ/EcaC family oxidoreductase [Pseudomonas sp. LS1212]